MQAPIALELPAWRRPFQGVSLMLGLAIGSFLVGCVAVLAAARLGASVTVVRAILVVVPVGMMTILLAWDHRRHPAATLHIDSSRLVYREVGGRVVDAPLSDVRILVYQQGQSGAVHVGRHAPIYLHQSRLSVPVEPLFQRIGALVAEGGGGERYNKSAPAAWRSVLVKRLVVASIVAVAFLGLMRALTPHSP